MVGIPNLLPARGLIPPFNEFRYFDRDVQCVRTFFKKRFHFEGESYPTFASVKRKYFLDTEVAASGFSKESQAEFEEVKLNPPPLFPFLRIQMIAVG